MGAVLVGLVVIAMVALPLVLAVRSDRRREAADQVAARARSAVRQRLGGEAFVTVDVSAPTLTQHGRVVLTAPTGYDWMVERTWSAVAASMPRSLAAASTWARSRLPSSRRNSTSAPRIPVSATARRGSIPICTVSRFRQTGSSPGFSAGLMG